MPWQDALFNPRAAQLPSQSLVTMEAKPSSPSSTRSRRSSLVKVEDKMEETWRRKGVSLANITRLLQYEGPPSNRGIVQSTRLVLEPLQYNFWGG